MSAVVWTPYCGAGPIPAELWGRWNLDPVLLLLFGGLGGAYALWAAPRPDARPALAVAAGVVLALALVSPLCALSSALFSARAVHHLLLVNAAAPLIVWALPASWLRAAPGLAAATLLQAAAYWIWHAPGAYASALSATAVYAAMVLSLLVSAVAFWAAVRRAPPLSAAAALLVTMMQMGVLGALLTFAAKALYAPHWTTTASWGLSPLEDQQLAGLIMWAPTLVLYLPPALLLVGRALRTGERRAMPA